MAGGWRRHTPVSFTPPGPGPGERSPAVPARDGLVGSYQFVTCPWAAMPRPVGTRSLPGCPSPAGRQDAHLPGGLPPDALWEEQRKVPEQETGSLPRRPVCKRACAAFLGLCRGNPGQKRRPWVAAANNPLTGRGGPGAAKCHLPGCRRLWPRSGRLGGRLSLPAIAEETDLGLIPGGLLAWDGDASGLQSHPEPGFGTRPGLGVSGATAGLGGGWLALLQTRAVRGARPRRSRGFAGQRCPGHVLARDLVPTQWLLSPLLTPVPWGGCSRFLGVPPAEPAASPGAAPARRARPPQEAAEGDRAEGGEAVDVLGEALRAPLPRPGLLGPASAAARRRPSPRPPWQVSCSQIWSKFNSAVS
ncbi:transcription initiation factor TFIID subunit 4-like [Apteryx rowi]|uniref:transcription initiation factor TFIID subunit 4-like n=1 Tax=Apteryx rowi TaxID=308060 RepID=UPI000E1CBD43|nr:transcription initiation factor TFIID subunit 4-like [Apteryx rowi]